MRADNIIGIWKGSKRAIVVKGGAYDGERGRGRGCRLFRITIGETRIALTNKDLASCLIVYSKLIWVSFSSISSRNASCLLLIAIK